MATLNIHIGGSSSDGFTLNASANVTVTNTPTKTTVTISTITMTYTSISPYHVNNFDVQFLVQYDGSTAATMSVKSKTTSKTQSLNVNRTYTINKTHSSQGWKMILFGCKGEVGISDSHGAAAMAHILNHFPSSYNFTVEEKTNYQVYYNANGGKGAPDPQTKWYDESMTLRSAKPTRTNYDFKRWNTASNDSDTSYNPGATYTRNDGLYLFAIWNPLVYYKPNTTDSVSNMPATQTKVYGSTLSISTTRPTRAGYVFNSWNTNSSGTGTKYRGTNGTTTYATNSPLTLYAIWNPTVSYSANGGSGAPATQTKTFGTNLTLSTTRPTRVGYEFDGWNTKADGSGTSYSSGGTYSRETSVTLYAKWKRVPQPPTVSLLTAWRTNAQGIKDDSGTCALVTVRWAVDTFVTNNTIAASGGITGQYKSTTASTWSSDFTFYTTAGGSTLPSGASGTAYAIVNPSGGLSTDSQYSIKVTVKDKDGRTTSTTVVLTRAKFVLDFGAGGDSIGIGSAAPEISGSQKPLLEIGWQLQFDEDASMLKGLSVTGELAANGELAGSAFEVTSYTSDVATENSSSTWHIVTQIARKYMRIVEICVTFNTSSAVSASSVSSPINIGSIATEFAPSRPWNVSATLYQGFANEYGIGYVTSSGGIYFRPLVDIGTSTNVRVALTYIK